MIVERASFSFTAPMLETIAQNRPKMRKLILNLTKWDVDFTLEFLVMTKLNYWYSSVLVMCTDTEMAIF